MVSEEAVKEQLQTVKDPDIHKNLLETGGIRELKIKEGYVGLKVALARINTSEQMQVQSEIVNKVKSAGAETVGLRFEALTEEEIEQAGGLTAEDEDAPPLLSRIVKRPLLPLQAERAVSASQR